MQQIADRLETIGGGLKVFGYPPNKVTAPAAIVTYPGDYTFDGSYGRGMDKITIPVVLLVGKVDARTSRDRISKYANGSGPESVKAVVESGVYTAFDSVRVTGVEFDIVGMAADEFLAATFSLDIAGKGTA
jgi:hypothetical protein